MQISLRSQLITGTAAIVGATAITMGGVVSPAVSPALPGPAVAKLAEVQLTAFANPLLEIYNTIERTNLYLFSIAESPVTEFSRAGIIPQFLSAGLPILSQYFVNASDYVSQTVSYAFSDLIEQTQILDARYPGAFRILTWAVDALPANLGVAAQQVFSGSLTGALRTLQFAVLNPAQAALYQVLNAGNYVLAGVAARAAAVVTAIADWVPTTIRNLADDGTVVLNAVGNVVGNVLFGIQTLNPETVWNSLVVGLLGVSPDPRLGGTVPDALINQTIGEGCGGSPQSPACGLIPTGNVVPSLRQNVIDLNTALTDALATAVPDQDFPPFLVARPPFSTFFNQIPTPWQPTPPVFPQTPVASSVRAAAVEAQPSSATAAAVEAAEAADADADVAAAKPTAAAPDRAGARGVNKSGGDRTGSGDKSSPRAAASR